MDADSTRNNGLALPFFLAVIISLVVYLLTMSRSVGWHDSAELALTAWLPAANHAPGSPLHSLLGYLPAHLFADAFLGTTLLSVSAAAISAGVLAALMHVLVRDKWLAVLSALLFAFSFQVWATSVITEVYSLGMCFLSGALLSAWFWRSSGSRVGWLAMLICYGLALSAYFANILLWPAFAYLVYKSEAARLRNLLLFSAATGVATLLIALANYSLAINALPYGSLIPDSPGNLWSYMSGAQHDPLQMRAGSGLLLGRVLEHAATFGRSVGFLPVLLSLCGIYALYKQDAVYALFSVFVFLIYTVYYTLFGPGDYYLMVVPAYFVVAVWAGLGVGWLGQRVKWSNSALLANTVLCCVVIVLLASQFNGRRTMASVTDAEIFAEESFAFLPADAFVVTGWKELTPLTYFQVVYGIRTDLRFIVPAEDGRYYIHGYANNYAEAVESVLCLYPVFTTKPLGKLNAKVELVKETAAVDWMRVTPVGGCQ